MATKKYHIAQVDIALMRAALRDPLMAEFVASLDEINALADGSPGFVWRLQTDQGNLRSCTMLNIAPLAPQNWGLGGFSGMMQDLKNATNFRPYGDERILFNLSVWESIEELRTYVYKSAHGEIMQKRRQWFDRFEGMYFALWWVEAGHIPNVMEAKQKPDYLNEHGASNWVFDFKNSFPSPESSA